MTSTTELATSGSGSGTILKADKRGRILTSAQQREQMMMEYDRSGMSTAEFAKCHGLKYTTLSGWLQRRRQAGGASQDKEAKGIQWVEAVVSRPQGGGGVIMHLPGGVRMEVRDAAVAVAMLKGLGVKVC